jgi:beta-galactosidase
MSNIHMRKEFTVQSQKQQQLQKFTLVPKVWRLSTLVAKETYMFDPKTMWLGASWYPEMWPEEEWTKDADKMHELGFNVMRLFEFAWHKFEPQEGQFDFAWAIRVMDILHERGIGVVIGTPSAAPPAWMSHGYPEILKVKFGGVRAKHGKRCHGSPVSQKYREFCGKITAAMVKALGDHPACVGWQIDNEMGGVCFSDEALVKFREFLQERFGTIEALNQAWGLGFWSQAYDSFEQIEFTKASVGSRDLPERAHPSLIMAQGDFQNEQWRQFMAHQIAILKQHTDKPVSSNMTGFVGGMDWFRHWKEYDMAGASMYADMSYYHLNFARFDRLRGEKAGTPWVLWETAPNWSGGGPIWNIHHEPAGVRVASWLTTINGSAGTVFWQWRSHWAGQEMQHGTHVNQTGSWQPGKKVWTQLGNEYREHGPWMMENRAEHADIALVASCEASWAFGIDPIHPDNKYETRFRDDYHLPLARRHWYRDVIHPSNNFDRYKVLVYAHQPVITADARERLQTFVQNGGVVILGPFVGTRTEEFTAWTDQAFGGLEDLIGADSAVRFSPHWVEDTITVDLGDGVSSNPRIWCEGFAPRDGTTVLASYEGGWGGGSAAIIEHRYGKGTVITVGTAINEAAYVHLVERACSIAGVEKVAEGSEKVLVAPRANAEGKRTGYGLVNYTKEPQEITLPVSGIDRLTGTQVGGTYTLPPLTVQLIELQD